MAKRRQGLPRIRHRTFFPAHPLNQARGLDKSKGWFWKGLERFANASDSPEDYQALGKAWPTFWPLPIEDGHGRDLAWSAEAQKLFNFYRDTLRRFWTRDPLVLKDGLRTQMLFGTFAPLPQLLSNPLTYSAALDTAIAPLANTYPNLQPLGVLPVATFWPDWNSGSVLYASHTDFQRAVWSLFLESWRAKVCPQCSTYLIAEKAPQIYCSVTCSNRAHQLSSLKHWRERGAARRAAKTRTHLAAKHKTTGANFRRKR
jgi:hypothetical protein